MAQVLNILEFLNIQKMAEEDDTELRMLVHQSRAGAIIGFKGQTIKELRESSGCKINVLQVNYFLK